METFIDSGIRFEYTLSSSIKLPQPQPTIEDDTITVAAPKSKFNATVKAIALPPLGPAAIANGRWRAGFIQETTSTGRIGHYDSDYRTETRIWQVPSHPLDVGRSIRDSEGGDAPYDGDPEELEHNEDVQLSSSDAPNLELPLHLPLKDVDPRPDLTTIAGRDQFTIWLAATKEAPPKRIVILGRIHWRVDWRVAVQSHAQTAMIARDQGLAVHGQPEFHIARGFARGALPPGYPQDLTTTEGNELVYCVTYHNGLELSRAAVVTDPSELPVPYGMFGDTRREASSWWG